MTSYALAPVDELQIIARLALTLTIGAIIGIEREAKRKAAGLRTNMLVSFGSALIVLVPIQLGIAQENPEAFMRAVSGVVSGVGFIGAGTILQNPKIRGLTSAAAIWMSAALGIIVGSGLLGLGFTCSLVTWVVLRMLGKLEKRWSKLKN
ncbi:magnesium transporter MgtC [Leptolyngbya valderiana BDU 20041]|uniref:MgtC/SapB family protein n=1 Tax=Baaleninema simplex TaxID=2862350 RepID=UPI0003452F8A|nr:MgtC/SapB family protein [Baaleninema simplex]MDC0833873.1 MgtC/SapB family protein [Geitlerinema sp. CS-897]OAB59563.1 magnesium transporter MgtC [Leptolyngbya valderiana BDU 20041]PPT11152.1 Mg(2+) transport ATPase protein C [Geitlerinema sp. FC II]